MKRYKKLCLEAENGIFFEVEEKYNGYVIERCSDGSQFVWVPVKFLIPDGTIDGMTFENTFGRRYYIEEEYIKCIGYYEDLTEELSSQIESVTTYGGFYISRFDISKSKDGKPQSVKGCVPWVNISQEEAKKVASLFENTDDVKSHLPFGAEYDSILAWLFMAKEIEFNMMTEWPPILRGKYIAWTGSNERCCKKNIYDYHGNVRELTQEKYTLSDKKTQRDKNIVIRGGSYLRPTSVAKRFDELEYIKSEDVGFRIALWLK